MDTAGLVDYFWDYPPLTILEATWSCCCDATLTHTISSRLPTLSCCVALLRCQARAVRPCTLIPSRHIPPVRAHTIATPFIAPPHPPATHLLLRPFQPSKSTLTSKHLPVNWLCPPSLPVLACVQLSRSSRNDALLPLVPPQPYWMFRGAHDSLKTHSPRSHATYRAIARGIRSGPLGPSYDTLPIFRSSSCRTVPQLPCAFASQH